MTCFARVLLSLVLLALVPAASRAATVPAPRPTADDTIPPPREVGRKPPAIDGTLAHEGRKLFLKLQCVTCHSAAAKAKAKGPLLDGLFGTKVALTRTAST